MPGEDPSPETASSNQSSRSSGGWFSSLKSRLFSSSEQSSLRQDLQTILETEVAADNVFSAEELRMLRNIMALKEGRVDDVMVPRADIIAVDEKVSIGELLVTFESAGHSRIPVYRDSLDEPLGMIHIKDLLSHMVSVARQNTMTTKTVEEADLSRILDLGCIDMTATIAELKLMRTVLFVPASMPIIDLLVKMQTTRIHMAVVVDEYGGTDGLVSIEDLVETVVGDIEDEHDVPEDQLIVQQAPNVLLVDARAPIEEFSEVLGVKLDDEEALEDVDTVGGYVFSLIGRVPVRGELIPFNGDFEFEILEADPRRIKRLRAQKRPRKQPRKEEKPEAKAKPEEQASEESKKG